MRYALWIVQGLLALLFVFAGGFKLVTPADVLAEQSGLPGLFIQVIGLCELLGGLGLVLPTLLRIRPELTVLAALELTHVMLGAAIISVATLGPIAAIMPLVVGALCGFVAYGRRNAAARRVDTLSHAAYSAS